MADLQRASAGQWNRVIPHNLALLLVDSGTMCIRRNLGRYTGDSADPVDPVDRSFSKIISTGGQAQTHNHLCMALTVKFATADRIEPFKLGQLTLFLIDYLFTVLSFLLCIRIVTIISKS
jgi:hypothetical protein